MNLRGATEELAFRGALMMFNVRSRYELTMRIDDEVVARFPATPVTNIMERLTEAVTRLQGDGIVIGETVKVTLQHGYLLMFKATRGGRSLRVTYELSH